MLKLKHTCKTQNITVYFLVQILENTDGELADLILEKEITNENFTKK